MYNVEDFIVKCLESCVKQDIPLDSYEIICVNDGSPDKSREIAEQFALDHPNVKVISQENKGLGGARNTGLANAHGDYVWFIDSDDWIQENCLGKMTRLCEDNDLDMLRICAANVYGEEIVRRFSYNDEGTVFRGVDVLKEEIPFCATFSIYRRDFLIKHDLFFYVGIYHEDNEFTPRAYYYAKKMSSMNDIIYYVYQNPNSITRTVNPKKVYDCILVMNRLEDFMVNEAADAKKVFHYHIAVTFNAALHNTIGISDEEIARLNEELFNNKHLYSHLVYSGRMKYALEGLLFKVFPRKVINIYYKINRIDK